MWFYPRDKLPTDGTKFCSINHHCGEKKKKNQSQNPELPRVMQCGQKSVLLPRKLPLQQPLVQNKNNPTLPSAARIWISHPVTEVRGVVLASWSGMCASEELVRKWETLCFLPFPLSKGS